MIVAVHFWREGPVSRVSIEPLHAPPPMNVERTFRQAAAAEAKSAARPLRVAAVWGKQVAGRKRLLQPDRKRICDRLHKRMGGTGLAVDQPADRGPGHADIGGEAGASLEAVAADVDHDRLHPVMKSWPGWTVAL